MASREALRALATEYPGALRELDTLSAHDMDARADRLEAVARGESPADDWMRWIQGYHSLMRAALWIRIAGTGTDPSDGAIIEALAREATTVGLWNVDGDFVRDVMAKRCGGLKRVVSSRLSADVGVDPGVLRRALFARRDDGRVVQ